MRGVHSPPSSRRPHFSRWCRPDYSAFWDQSIMEVTGGPGPRILCCLYSVAIAAALPPNMDATGENVLLCAFTSTKESRYLKRVKWTIELAFQCH